MLYKDQNQDDSVVCHVYDNPSPFQDPCDSRMLGVCRVCRHNARVKVLTLHELNWPAIKVPDGMGHIVLMKILHDF